MIVLHKISYEKVALFTIILLLASLIINPTVGRYGTFLGLQICGNVIIPSLFPFTFLSIFLIKCRLIKSIVWLDKLTRFILGINANELMLFIMSCIGGYPLGAKLLNEKVKEGEMSEKRASYLAMAFVNPGPAFCLSVVGVGIFSSREIGVMLYITSVISSVIILEAMRFFKTDENKTYSKKTEKVSILDGFVLSAYETSTAIISICVFVIFFSFITAYFDFLAKKIVFFSKISLLLEITSAMTKTKNLYLISFLLGFSCLSIILQIFSIAKEFRIKKYFFIFWRILNGVINFGLTKLFVKIFGLLVKTSQKVVFNYGSFFTNPLLCFALSMMVIVFLISITAKNSAWKLRDDVV